eukprot:5926400-Pyramimonas_sp.AAC.1
MHRSRRPTEASHLEVPIGPRDPRPRAEARTSRSSTTGAPDPTLAAAAAEPGRSVRAPAPQDRAGTHGVKKVQLP